MKISEEEFLSRIDCNFPYDNYEKGKNIINEAIAISPTTVYKVLDEIVRPPYGTKIDVNIMRQLLDYLFEKYQSNELDIIKETCYKMIDGIENSVDEGIKLMDHLKNYRKSNIPLNIIYFSVDDVDGELEKQYQKIIENWCIVD